MSWKISSYSLLVVSSSFFIIKVVSLKWQLIIIFYRWALQVLIFLIFRFGFSLISIIISLFSMRNFFISFSFLHPIFFIAILISSNTTLLINWSSIRFYFRICAIFPTSMTEKRTNSRIAVQDNLFLI